MLWLGKYTTALSVAEYCNQVTIGHVLCSQEGEDNKEENIFSHGLVTKKNANSLIFLAGGLVASKPC